METFYLLSVTYEADINKLPCIDNIMRYDLKTVEVDETDENLSEIICDLISERSNKIREEITDTALNEKNTDLDIEYAEIFSDVKCITDLIIKINSEYSELNRIQVSAIVDYFQHLKAANTVTVSIDKNDYYTIKNKNDVNDIIDIFSRYCNIITCMLYLTDEYDMKDDIVQTFYIQDISMIKVNMVLIDEDGKSSKVKIKELDADACDLIFDRAIAKNHRVTRELFERIKDGKTVCMLKMHTHHKEDNQTLTLTLNIDTDKGIDGLCDRIYKYRLKYPANLHDNIINITQFRESKCNTEKETGSN